MNKFTLLPWTTPCPLPRTGLFDDYFVGHVICFTMISEKALKK
jgi:hypothetical protein